MTEAPERRQQIALAKPFADRLIQQNPSGGGQYVKHSAVNEKLLAVLEDGFDWECVQVIRGYVPEVKPNPNATSRRGQDGRPALDNAVVGYVGRLTVTVDGSRRVIEETGDCEDPNNWPHDGARLKDASSDAFKRCAMRLGVGLHLWSQSDFFLYPWLSKDETPSEGPQ